MVTRLLSALAAVLLVFGAEQARSDGQERSTDRVVALHLLSLHGSQQDMTQIAAEIARYSAHNARDIFIYDLARKRQLFPDVWGGDGEGKKLWESRDIEARTAWLKQEAEEWRLPQAPGSTDEIEAVVTGAQVEILRLFKEGRNPPEHLEVFLWMTSSFTIFSDEEEAYWHQNAVNFVCYETGEAGALPARLSMDGVKVLPRIIHVDGEGTAMPLSPESTAALYMILGIDSLDSAQATEDLTGQSHVACPTGTTIDLPPIDEIRQKLSHASCEKLIVVSQLPVFGSCQPEVDNVEAVSPTTTTPTTTGTQSTQQGVTATTIPQGGQSTGATQPSGTTTGQAGTTTIGTSQTETTDEVDQTEAQDSAEVDSKPEVDDATPNIAGQERPEDPAVPEVADDTDGETGVGTSDDTAPTDADVVADVITEDANGDVTETSEPSNASAVLDTDWLSKDASVMWRIFVGAAPKDTDPVIELGPAVPAGTLALLTAVQSDALTRAEVEKAGAFAAKGRPLRRLSNGAATDSLVLILPRRAFCPSSGNGTDVSVVLRLPGAERTLVLQAAVAASGCSVSRDGDVTIQFPLQEVTK